MFSTASAETAFGDYEVDEMVRGMRRFYMGGSTVAFWQDLITKGVGCLGGVGFGLVCCLFFVFLLIVWFWVGLVLGFDWDWFWVFVVAALLPCDQFGHITIS